MNDQILVGVVVGLMITGAIVDARTHKLPDIFNLWIFIAGAIATILDSSLILEKLLGLVIMPALMIVANITIKGAFGGGDIKFVASCGLFFGIKIITRALLYAMMLAGIYGAIVLLFTTKKAHEGFALGPFLVVGVIASTVNKKSEVFIKMQPYQIVGVGLIAIGVITLAIYFYKKRKRKDDDYVDRLKIH